MTRQEEIKEMAKTTASHITSNKDMQVAFADALKRGAIWADETMLNKACDWLEKALPLHPNDRGEFIEDFRTIMKGEQI